MDTHDKAIRIDKVRQKRRAFGGARALFKLTLLTAIVIATLVSVSRAMDSIADIEAQTAVAEAQIAEAEARRREIEDSAAYVSSIRFIEYIARTRLRLVHRDEIIFNMVYE